ncbi:MAG: aminoglycoside phosphotransferase family protein [Candidatus Limnocylindrales bacterium]
MRFALFSPDAEGRVLTEPGGRLPSWESAITGHDDPVMPTVRVVLAERYGVTAPILELHAPDGGEGPTPGPVLVVTEPRAADESPPGGLTSALLAEIGPDAVPPELVPRLSTWTAELGHEAPVPALRPAWSRPGWASRVTGWLDTELTTLGRPRTGPLVQMRAWGISTLLRTETTDGAIWVKAAFPPFHAEPTLTRFLHARFPGLTASVVATNDAEGWTALDEFSAAVVGGCRDVTMWRSAADLLAGMQHALANADGRDALRRAAAASRPLDRLADDLEGAFFAHPRVIEWPYPDDRLREMVEGVRAAAGRMERLGIPETLIHGDFHPWNVAIVDGRPLIFDWTDSAVGNPMVDLATWIDAVPEGADRDRIWAEWVEAWSDVVPAEDMRARYDDVVAIGSAYQVVSYDVILRGLEPATRPTIAHGATSFARLLDEALRPVADR